MKKKFDLWVHCDPSLKKIFMELKIAIFIIVVSVSNVFATPSYSQVARVSLDMKDKTLDQVMDEIERQSDFYFIFNQKQIDINRVVDIEVNNKLITDVLPELFKGTNVNYAIFDKKILLTTDRLDKSILVQANITELQQNQIIGKVTDEKGNPIAGVTVSVKGTATGTLTDATGRYIITNPPNNATLIFTFIGMAKQEIQVAGQMLIDVVLKEEAVGLDEVVVIGYGTVLKKDLTGSVEGIQLNVLKDLNVTRVENALAGQVSGVQVINNTGQPGESAKIRIRGIGSITAGAAPLYVVDGYPVPDIQMINPNDVESIDVLKDASATAIYGSRGANGVIIVTTRRGTAGKSVISLDTYTGFQEVTQTRKFLTREEQANYYYLGIKNQNLDAGNDVSGDPLTWAVRMPKTVMDVLQGRNTVNSNMYKDIFRTAPESSFNLSARGGNESVKYSVSGEYLNQDGILQNTNFKRYSLRANLDAQLSKRLSIKFNINTAFSTSTNPTLDGDGGIDAIFAASTWQYWYPEYNPDGSYFSGFGTDTQVALWNPLATLKEIKRRSDQLKVLGNLFTEYKISDALALNVMLGANSFNGHDFYFMPDLPVFSSVAEGSDARSNYLNWITETTLNYKKSFNKHNITGLLGFTSQKESDASNYLSSRDYLNNLVYTLNAVSNKIYEGNSLESQWSLVSYLARVNYNYNSKYYLTASIRRDGSSRFGIDRKYGDFPSIALAWRISEENFLKGNSLLNNLKIRASYGQTGNNNIGNYLSVGTINYASYVLGGSKVGGYAPEQFANPTLTWEKQSSYNVGIDASILKSRISFTADYFKTKNHGLLLLVNVPQITGFNSAIKNIGEVENKGWEFTVNTRNFVGAFQWTTDFNISTFKNKVIKLGPEGAPIITDFNITEIGQPMGMFYGYIKDGVFMTQAQLDAGPIWDPGFADHSRLGDIRFKDVSGPNGVPDGIVNSYDRTIMGSPYPDFYYCMSNSFTYKNVTLNVNLQGSYGNMVFNTDYSSMYSRSRHKELSLMSNYWVSEAEPGDGQTPRPNNAYTGGFDPNNSHYLRSGSFLRVNSINLSYSFPENIIKKLFLSSLRVYITATNPILITKNNLFSPESDIFGGNPLTPGLFANGYPVAKSYIFGLNVSF
jgi:TonB-linked SusC/RagA family outer membrane protein